MSSTRTNSINMTVATNASVESYLASIANPQRQADCREVCDLMQRLTGEPPRLWGPSIVGFGQYHYTYESGREGNFLRTGFANRAKAITLYIMPGYQDFDDELARLGPHTKGKSCLYIKRLSDIDKTVLEEIVAKGLSIIDARYPRR